MRLIAARFRFRRYFLSAFMLANALAGAPAKAQSGVIDAVAAGTPLIDVRLRYETVDQANKPKNAAATTLRARLGYQTGQYHGFSALAEFDGVQHLGPQHYFNSFGGAPSALYPTIADPDLVGLNRLQLSYAMRLTDGQGNGAPDLRFALGRQRLIFGDQRFVGNVGWRQHEQTFDGVSLVDASLAGTILTYAYITRVNRVFGPESPMGTFDSHNHLFDAVYTGFMPLLRLEAFAHLLDLRQVRTSSTATFGFRGDGTADLGWGVKGLLNASYARQTDYAKNPLDIGLSYYLGEAGFSFKGATALAGYEVLEGNGAIGFSTPLATLHIFQGWADVFLTTPVKGIEDLHFKGSYVFDATPVIPKIAAMVFYHDFSAQRGNAHYGGEWDAQLEAIIDAHITAGVKYAAFQGDARFADKNVGWLYIGYRY
jgi:hypothetical protein